jgi:8-oxo-dGTP pyrophosphatase MutT (NUDIX family)
VGFPGGRIEPGDSGAEAAALREAEEEIGLPQDHVRVFGRLPPYDTRTGFRVHPILGEVRPPPVFSPDRSEVEAVFELPLSFFLDPENRGFREVEIGGATRGFHVFDLPPHLVWGATAGILVTLAEGLGP